MYSPLFVTLMGIGTVFFGLICIIALSKLMSSVCIRTERRPAAAAAASAPAAPVESAADRQALIAAVSAAVAEEMGTAISGIRILSMRKI